MEYVDGVTVREWLAAAPRAWREIRDAFVHAGRGIAAAHAIGIVHRDVKPANILVAADRVRIADFGLARAAEQVAIPPATPIAPARGTMTEAGAILGTPRYMAPEQRSAGRADAASDQYSFCVSLAEALEDRPDVPGWLLKVVAFARLPGSATRTCPRCSGTWAAIPRAGAGRWRRCSPAPRC
jgi:serine/threonine protein kinase